MAPVSRRTAGTARVAVVGAATSDGTRVREVLASRGVPGSRVDLYSTHGEDVLLSEYAGEARLIQDPEVSEIAGHDVVFLCEPSELSRRVVSDARPGSVAIDLVGALAPPPKLIHLDLNPHALDDNPGVLAVPHPLAIVLAELLQPLESAFGIDEVVAVVIRPAADFGQQGVEELRDQTIRLLNFDEVPVDTFGRQLAFNIIPQEMLSGESPGVEMHIAQHVTDLLGWAERRITLKLLTAAVFYGHGLQLRLRLNQRPGLDEVRKTLESGKFVNGSQPGTPLDVSNEPEIRLAELCEDGLDGLWLWAVSGKTGNRGAEHAVRLAASLCDL